MRVVCALGLAVIALVGCSSNESRPRADALRADQYICHQPPDITQCQAPPNNFSATLYFCDGCGYCGGGSPTAACDDFTDDCRLFYDSCIPKTYEACKTGASQTVLFLCETCFRNDGGIPAQCNRLPDAGSAADQALSDGGDR